MKLDLIYPLSAPPGAPGGPIFFYPNTIPEHISPMIIYTKFEQNQMEIVGGVVFFSEMLTYERRRTTTDEVGSVKLT